VEGDEIELEDDLGGGGKQDNLRQDVLSWIREERTTGASVVGEGYVPCPGRIRMVDAKQVGGVR